MLLRTLAVSMVLSLAATAPTAAAPASSATGRWILNMEQSTPGATPIRSAEATLADDGLSLTYDTTSVGLDGKPSRQTGADVFGKTVLGPNGKDQRRVTRVDANTIKRSVRYGDGGSLEDVCVFTPKVMTCKGVRTRGGVPEVSTTVFDRAPD